MTIKKNKKTPDWSWLVAAVAIFSLVVILIYSLFLIVYLNPDQVNSNGNINGRKKTSNLELGYDPLITVVPKDLQNEGAQGKFLISSADPIAGLSTAKIIIVVWSRFDNNDAKNFSAKLPEIKNKYGDDLIIVWKDMADPNNTQEIGGAAAMAAHCANEQGKFWEYHDKLFANIDNLKAENFSAWAQELSLDTTVFDRCVAEKSSLAIVTNNYYYAKNYNISSTPTVYVNDEQVGDLDNIDKIYELVDKKLATYESEE